MLPFGIYTRTAAAAVLAATAFANWHRAGVQMPAPTVQTVSLHDAPARINADASYLPALFDEEERAARIEPLPPQF